jgi:hypothetical protein
MSIMATLNWDNANRQIRLAKWIAQSELSPKWWERDQGQQANLEAWAKRQSAEIVKRLSKNHKAQHVPTALALLDEAIQKNDEKAIKYYAQKTLNENSIRNSVSKEELDNLTLLVQMALCIAD